MNQDNSAIRVRRARADDASEIAAFNIAMALETEDKVLDPDVIEAGVSRMVTDDRLGFYLVGEYSGQVVGCLGVTYEWSDWRNGLFWWIQSVYVLPEYRRRNVFAGMYRKTHELAAEQPDICGIRLYVEKENERARSTYLALGMSMTHYDLLEVEF
ncbi:MAG: GNAT family N-acetyltransferase [Pseudomonadales bacterium]|nr:GNAT family N-acetyltransferase [Pseudomonadales bacterium]